MYKFNCYSISDILTRRSEAFMDSSYKVIEFDSSKKNDNTEFIKELKDELNDRIKDHEITYRELFDLIGIYPSMEYIDEYGKADLDKIAIHNPELNNGAYI